MSERLASYHFHRDSLEDDWGIREILAIEEFFGVTFK